MIQFRYMVDDSLVQHVKVAKSQGFNNEYIKDVLIKNGWPQKSIDIFLISLEAINKISSPLPANKKEN